MKVDLLKRGYVLTSEKCPKCGAPLLRDPKTGLKVCSVCDYEESEITLIENKIRELFQQLSSEKNPKEIYYIVRSVKELLSLKRKYKDNSNS